jgi:hypothetical protein
MQTQNKQHLSFIKSWCDLDDGHSSYVFCCKPAGSASTAVVTACVHQGPTMTYRISEISKWFVPPVVVPIIIALLVVTAALSRQFA